MILVKYINKKKKKKSDEMNENLCGYTMGE